MLPPGNSGSNPLVFNPYPNYGEVETSSKQNVRTIVVPNLNDDEPPTDALLEAQLRMAMQLQLERDAFLQERAQRLRDEPNLGMIALKEVSKFGRTLVDLLRQRKKNVLTEEEKKEHQLNNLRRDLYGDGGMPAEEIDLQSSDDEDAW